MCVRGWYARMGDPGVCRESCVYVGSSRVCGNYGNMDRLGREIIHAMF